MVMKLKQRKIEIKLVKKSLNKKEIKLEHKLYNIIALNVDTM